MTVVLIEVVKIGLLSFLVLGICAVAVVYHRRRWSGGMSWRPQDSRFLGQDPTVARIDPPPGPPHTDGGLTTSDTGEPDVLRRRADDDAD